MKQGLSATCLGLLGLSGLMGAAGLGCSPDPRALEGLSSFRVAVTAVNGAEPPTEDAPRPANLGDEDDVWTIEASALDPFGNPVDFDGLVRVRIEPGAVTSVEGEGAVGRNIQVVGGKGAADLHVTAMFGPTRLWVEDVGYVPAPAGEQPACADGKDNDDDVTFDFPQDPGCAFADDDTEEEGSFAAGVSPPVHYALPRLSDIQGHGPKTPYSFESVQVRTDSPQEVIVTRVSSDGFYATDVADPGGYNHIFAFNFSTPPGLRVCDRVTYLSGTLSEFFGFTEVSFPSYERTFTLEGEADCKVPEPTVLDQPTLLNAVAMESLESSLVRIEGYHVSKYFGPEPNPKHNWANNPNATNCDLTGDGQIDFENDAEASCANACSDDPECTEWTGFSARGNFKMSKGSAASQILVNTGAVAEFDPPSFRGAEIIALTGTMRNFSGGSLNWTIETRCPDDLVCSPDVSDACAKVDVESTENATTPISSKKACVRLRTIEDPDEGTN